MRAVTDIIINARIYAVFTFRLSSCSCCPLHGILSDLVHWFVNTQSQRLAAEVAVYRCRPSLCNLSIYDVDAESAVATERAPDR